MADGDAYTVKKKDEIRKLNEAGDVETWYRVWATSKGGTYFHVDIKEDQLTNADKILTARAKQLDAV